MPRDDSTRAADREPDRQAAIDREAGEWFGRRARGLTPAEEVEFANWLENDPRHAASLAELDETWGRLDRLPELGRKRVLGLPRRRRAKIVWIPVALAAAALVLVIFNPALLRSGAASLTQDATEIGGLKRLPLPDGSVVQLNTRSAIEVEFSREVRRVRLVRGEAHFAVAKDPARPFVVMAGGVAVRAVGTAFNVRLEQATVEVLVTEGEVRVDDATKGASLLPATKTATPPVLAAGACAVVATRPDATEREVAAITTVPSAEILRRLAWQERRLEFDGAPLAEVVREFNRYNRHQLIVADAQLAARSFGGTIQLGDPDVLVRLLEVRFGVVAERGAEVTVLRSAR